MRTKCMQDGSFYSWINVWVAGKSVWTPCHSAGHCHVECKLWAVCICICSCTRLRIGHSRVTHSYLLSRESQPVCDHCKCLFTVKHMLLECPSTVVVRLKHLAFSSTTLKELFSKYWCTLHPWFYQGERILPSHLINLLINPLLVF